MAKTTKKDFEVFKKECWKWIDYFGLKGWDYNFTHGESLEGSVASYTLQYAGRLVSFYLADDILQKISRRDIQQYAFHEVCHVLLQGLARHAYNMVQDDIVGEAAHKIIAILENTVFKDLA